MHFLRWSVLILALLNGGCVAYQMRDELRQTNLQLASANTRLDKIAGELAEVHSTIAQTDAKLDRSNQSLVILQSSMEPIRVSMRRIDDELSGFREMFDKIDRYIPLNIKADTPPPEKQTPTRETTPGK